MDIDDVLRNRAEMLDKMSAFSITSEDSQEQFRIRSEGAGEKQARVRKARQCKGENAFQRLSAITFANLMRFVHNDGVDVERRRAGCQKRGQSLGGQHIDQLL